jgi:hypothetical protein
MEKARKLKQFQFLEVFIYIRVWRKHFLRSECTNYLRTKASLIGAAITGWTEVRLQTAWRTSSR